MTLYNVSLYHSVVCMPSIPQFVQISVPYLPQLHVQRLSYTNKLLYIENSHIFCGTLCRKKRKESALVNFWYTIDTNLWYQWFHTDKIILILHQDTYLPRNLLSPSANHRFATFATCHFLFTFTSMYVYMDTQKELYPIMCRRQKARLSQIQKALGFMTLQAQVG